MDSTDYQLILRQSPTSAKQCSLKDRVDRRPLDPPPVIQLVSNSDDKTFLHNPYLFLKAVLIDANTKKPIKLITNSSQTTCSGKLLQSIHRLSDLDGKLAGFFIFNDLSIRVKGDFQLKFSLYQIKEGSTCAINEILTSKFTVFPNKLFPGYQPTTDLTMLLVTQGIRLKVHKLNSCSPPKSEMATEMTSKTELSVTEPEQSCIKRRRTSSSTTDSIMPITPTQLETLDLLVRLPAVNFATKFNRRCPTTPIPTRTNTPKIEDFDYSNRISLDLFKGFDNLFDDYLRRNSIV